MIMHPLVDLLLTHCPENYMDQHLLNGRQSILPCHFFHPQLTLNETGPSDDP